MAERVQIDCDGFKELISNHMKAVPTVLPKKKAKLFAPKTPAEVCAGRARSEPVCDRFQTYITNSMSICVIDPLEEVDINNQQIAAFARKRGFHCSVEEGTTAWQLRQIIRQSKL